jgi:hypothetical protein
MALVKIKLVDAAGQAFVGQTVKVTGCGALQTNIDGKTQFLLDANVSIEVDINGTHVWAGNSDQLARDESFQQTATGFARIAV